MKQTDREAAHAILFALIKSAKDVTFKGTYERLRPASDGCIRTVHSPASTDTGRFNSSETFLEESTNLQNLSVKYAKLDPLYNIKDVILAPPGRALGEIDLSQAEARVAAYMAEDELAIRQYVEGVDRYRFLAAFAFHGSTDASSLVTKPQRDTGKMGLLAYQYGVSWKTWMDQTNHAADLTGIVVDAKTAKNVEGAFHELWPRYRPWHEEVLDEVLSKGYIRNPYGFRRDFFGRTDSPSALDQLKKAAVACYPQSTIAHHTGVGLLNLYSRYDPDILWLHAQIHDAIIFSTPVRLAMRTPRIVKESMEFSITINGRECFVPAEVKMSLGRWSEAKEAA